MEAQVTSGALASHRGAVWHRWPARSRIWVWPDPGKTRSMGSELVRMTGEQKFNTAGGLGQASTCVQNGCLRRLS